MALKKGKYIMSIKIILTGSFGVGKSSIFDRIIYDRFTDTYFGTIGVRVNSKELSIKETNISIQLWDVAGEVSQTSAPSNYFDDKQYIVYIVDLTRMVTIDNALLDIEFLKESYPTAKLLFVGNKTDLLLQEELQAFKNEKSTYPLDWSISAKTGENVHELFASIAEEYINSN